MDFNLIEKEYSYLQEEIKSVLGEISSISRNCILATGAVYSWLATSDIQANIKTYAWYIPVFFSVFGALRSWSLSKHLNNMGKYLLKVEHRYLTDTEALGWQHFFRAADSSNREKVGYIYWCTLVLATVVFGWLMSKA